MWAIPSLIPSRIPSRIPTLAAFDLVPGPSLTRIEDHEGSAWRSSAKRAEFHAVTNLAPGWYRIKLSISGSGQKAIRKSIRLSISNDAGVVTCDVFEWNDVLREDLLIQVPTAANSLKLTMTNLIGQFRLDRFEVRPVSRVRTTARAVRLKLKLLKSYNCFWPVVSRGGRLLVQGRFSEFRRKLLRGIPDSRTMRIEVKRAAEVSAMWWRRRAMSTEELNALRAEVEELTDPRPLAVLLPADPTRCDYARQAILSVLRQAYPHWELAIIWPQKTGPSLLEAVAEWDNRIRIVRGSGWRQATQRALESLESDQVVVLSPDWELGEQALLRLAQHDAESTAPTTLSRARIAKELPNLEATSAIGVVRWAEALVPKATNPFRETIAFPIDDGRALEIRRQSRQTQPLVLSADIRGISGWDHVAFEVLKGLHSAGIPIRHHSAAGILPDLLPPELQPQSISRLNEPQLVIAPPFGLKRYGIDQATAIYTMWETDRIESADVAVLNRARLVIVPSRWGAESFRASGVTVPIEIVPLGYDPLVFFPTGEKSAVCTFGTAGALSAGGLRKNIGRVVKLFAMAFPTESDVRLRVKITPNCPPFEIHEDPRVEVLRASLPYPDLARWNRSLDVYVNASFAEGFGLHLLEAMACGVPLISTEFSGVSEFFDSDVGYVVPHTLFETRNEYYRGRWADPDDNAIIERMREIYRDRAKSANLGIQAAARSRRFTWRDTGRRLLAALERHGILEAKR